MKEIDQRVENLRKILKQKGFDAYYVSGSDPHQSEYVAPRWRTRHFISGFSGSAGTVLITMDDAVLWTDSRYFIQAANEIKDTCFKMLRQDTEDPDMISWILSNLKKDAKIAVEASEISIASFNELNSKLEGSACFVPVEGILDQVWSGRPSVPETAITQMKLEYAGKTAEDKIASVRESLKEKDCNWTFIASLDDIAWLTNLRADDIMYNPVFYCYMFISMERAVLFTSKKRFAGFDTSSLPFEIMDYEEACDVLALLADKKGYYNPERIVMSFESALNRNPCLTGADITTLMKAKKNALEMEGMRRAHFEDAVAFVNFLAKLDPMKKTDELEIEEKLENERKRRPLYLGPSFSTIAGFKENGAMCHYRALRDNYKIIEGNGLLVLDSGGQYECGTTDITRTLLFGQAGEDEKRDYTLVLKGHLALAFQRFYKGTRGVQLDVLAKQFLWQSGQTFYHGTGHGVGCRLNVHEGPMRISAALIDVPLEEGMVISDEPGLYKEGRYGIRIENLIAVKDDVETEFGKFLSFEVLTMVPYEKRLIDTRYLSDVEINAINSYHKWVYETLKDHVDETSVPYLESATSPIVRK